MNRWLAAWGAALVMLGAALPLRHRFGIRRGLVIDATGDYALRAIAECIRRADEALHAAKQAGRDRVVAAG